MLASHALALVGVPMRRVIRIVQEQRDARYNLLRGYFHGVDDASFDESAQERLAKITCTAHAFAVGKHTSDLQFLMPDVRIVNLRSHTGKNIAPAHNPVVQAGDTLVVSAKADAIAAAQTLLLAPTSGHTH